MTVTYNGEVSNGSRFGCFWKILGKWRGSVYKLVWRELLAYLALYFLINICYRFLLNDTQQRIFERIRLYFAQQSESIPMSFVLGFYVSLVVKRWWDQYQSLPWPDTLALFLNAGIPGGDERQRLMRRNIVRYANLAYVITMQRVSLRVKKRFPTWQHVVDSGLMLENERKIFELMDEKTPMSKYWMPLVWATNIINRARKESLITSDHVVQTLLMELSEFRKRLGALIGYDTVCVPLVYTQVVTMALYTYFFAALIGCQYVSNTSEVVSKYEYPDMYFPLFLALQFVFYVGWLKVAEVLINPFGEDDDDIELNWLIDRHIKASYMIVDEMHEEHPDLLKDQYWDEVVPKELPYTIASEHYRRGEPKCSAEHYTVKPADAMYANLITPPQKHVDDMYADYESVDTPIVERRKTSNWFTRQISRTRSARSASTAYSSGGLFSRHRGNSVYANPEAGQLPGQPQPKMSIYDRLVGRRSSRTQKLAKQGNGTKVNGPNGNMLIKNRPRIPTPDAAKENSERDNTLISAISNQSLNQMIPPGLALMPQNLPYNTNDMPVLQMVLSPIQEVENASGNNTLHAGQPGTAALAQAVLTTGLQPVLTTPLTVSQLASMGLTAVTNNSPIRTRSIQHPPFICAFQQQTVKNQVPHVVLTEVTVPDDKDEAEKNISSNSSEASTTSEVSTASKKSKASKKSHESGGTDASGASKASTAIMLSSDLINLVPNGSPLNSLLSIEDRSRKASVVSQNNPKRGEVYV